MKLPYLFNTALVFLFALSSSGEKTPPDWAHLTLHNADWVLHVMDPTADDPFYQGQRFVHSAMVVNAFWRGIPIFTDLTNGGTKPRNYHDHVGGTAEEFDIRGPQGSDLESGQEIFLKPGVGLLRRLPEHVEEPYRFWRAKDLVRAPAFCIEQPDENRLIFEEILPAENGLPGYKMRSELSFLTEGNGFRIRRSLTWLGEGTLSTEHYSHSFILLNGGEVGRDYEVTWASPVEWVQSNADLWGANLSESDLSFLDTGDRSRSFHFRGEFGNEPASPFWVRVHQRQDNLTLRIESSEPVDRFEIWGFTENISPEMFVRFNLAHGETVAWETRWIIETEP